MSESVGKKTCFVISAIGPQGSVERRHADLVLNYIIRATLEDQGYSVERADAISHSGLITVNVVNAIFDADLVIADLSFLNPNVFYELGLRHSTKRATIHIASSETKLPFDNADHNTVVYDLGDWDSHEQARAQLKRLVLALAAHDVTNPVTVAHAHRNDARLSEILDHVAEYVEQIEIKVNGLTKMPGPGHITRDKFKEITEAQKGGILARIMHVVELRVA